MMNFIRKGESIVGKLTGFVSAFSIIGFSGVALIIAADVIKRFIVNEAVLGTYEIVERLLMLSVFASFAYTQFKKSHVRVTMLTMILPEKVQFLLYGLTCLLSAVLTGVLCYAVIGQVQYSYTAGTSTGVLYIPLFPFYIIECLGMGIYAITVLWDSIKGFLALGGGEPAEFLKSNWG